MCISWVPNVWYWCMALREDQVVLGLHSGTWTQAWIKGRLLSRVVWGRSFRWWDRFCFCLQLLTRFLLSNKIIYSCQLQPTFKGSVFSWLVNVGLAHVTCLANEIWVNPDTGHIREDFNVTACFASVLCQDHCSSQTAAASRAWSRNLQQGWSSLKTYMWCEWE